MNQTISAIAKLSIDFSNPRNFEINNLTFDIKSTAIRYLTAYRGNDQFLNDIKARLPIYPIPSDKQIRWIVIKAIENFNRWLNEDHKMLQINANGDVEIISTLDAEATTAGFPQSFPQTAPINLQCGTYTVDFGDEHRTLRVKPVQSDNPNDDRKYILQLLVGSDNESSYAGVAYVLKSGEIRVWAKKLRDEYGFDGNEVSLTRKAIDVLVGKSGGATVLESALCNRCGRKLTVPVSIHNGLGPECAKLS